jgi:hypothetical protein
MADNCGSRSALITDGQKENVSNPGPDLPPSFQGDIPALAKQFGRLDRK